MSKRKTPEELGSEDSQSTVDTELAAVEEAELEEGEGFVVPDSQASDSDYEPTETEESESEESGDEKPVRVGMREVVQTMKELQEQLKAAREEISKLKKDA